MCLTEDQADYVYTKCNKNGVTKSKCVTIPKEVDVKTQENDSPCPKKPYQCISINNLNIMMLKVNHLT